MSNKHLRVHMFINMNGSWQTRQCDSVSKACWTDDTRHESVSIVQSCLYQNLRSKLSWQKDDKGLPRAGQVPWRQWAQGVWVVTKVLGFWVKRKSCSHYILKIEAFYYYIIILCASCLNNSDCSFPQNHLLIMLRSRTQKSWTRAACFGPSGWPGEPWHHSATCYFHCRYLDIKVPSAPLCLGQKALG